MIPACKNHQRYATTCKYLHNSLVLLHREAQLINMVLPGVLFLQQIHAFLQLLEGLLQLEALPMQLVQHLHVCN